MGTSGEEPEGAGDTELSHSNEFILPEVVQSPILAMTEASLLPTFCGTGFSPPVEGTNPALSMEKVKTFLVSVTQHENVDIPEDHPHHPLSPGLELDPSLSRPPKVRYTV